MKDMDNERPTATRLKELRKKYEALVKGKDKWEYILPACSESCEECDYRAERVADLLNCTANEVMWLAVEGL